jgi:hypothetical protein
MTMLPLSRITAAFSVLLFMCSLAAFAQEDGRKAAVNPMRLSYAEGDVSFWRYGATDWVQAQLNTPVAAGDSLYVGKDGDLELEMGSRAFVRADDDTQLTLVNQTPDFAQFKITSGRVTFDLRTLPTGYSVELDTPNAVFTIDHVGYYRVDVDGDVHFITRRGGRATMVPAGGQAMSIHPSEEIVVQGSAVAQAETYVAPEIDRWDRWNYDRTDGLLDAVSERYLPYGVAGASDLDHYGSWRVVPDYGPIWVPDTVPPGWAPYSDGRWSWDPYYQWTWIDDAPWGWAPFHYGRWVYLGGYWAWAPGPVVGHPVYSPALVAFFNIGPHVSVGISSAGMGWVALGWGEPLMPWWGRPNFVGRPWWGGWGGPRVVNNVVVHNTTVVNVTNITYNNTHVNNAIVATTHDHFGNGHVQDAPVHVTQTQGLEHVHGALPVKPGPASLVAGAHNGTRPPESMSSRPVVATRPPHESRLPWRTEAPRPGTAAAQDRRYVLVPNKRTSKDLPRPEFGAQTGEERLRTPLPPRFAERRREAVPDNVIRERAETGRIESPVEPRTEPRIEQRIEQRIERGVSRTAPPEPATPPRVTREVAPPRAVQESHTVQERERVTQEPRRSSAAPVAPRAAPAETRQQERADLPGKPANRVFRVKERDVEKKDIKDINEKKDMNEKVERRRSQQKPDD